MTIDHIVQKRMFVLFLISQILIVCMNIMIFGLNEIIYYNRTIGWSFDFRYWVIIIKPFLWITVFLGYGVLILLRYFTNKILSIIHLISIFLIFIVEAILSLSSGIVLALMLFSALVFLMNFGWALKNGSSKSA